MDSSLLKVLKGQGEVEILPAVKEAKSTVASRKESWKEAVEEFDVDKLLEIQEEMDQFIDKMKVIKDSMSLDKIDLTEAEAKDLMTEYLSGKNIAEFLEARKSMVRKLVFQVIDERLREEGIEDPENQNGSIEVPELGTRFSREGAGYRDPSIDGAKLREILGDDYQNVVVKKIIPERVEEKVSEELLTKYLSENPEVLSELQEAVVPGLPKTPKLMIRKMK